MNTTTAIFLILILILILICLYAARRKRLRYECEVRVLVALVGFLNFDKRLCYFYYKRGHSTEYAALELVLELEYKDIKDNLVFLSKKEQIKK